MITHASSDEMPESLVTTEEEEEEEEEESEVSSREEIAGDERSVDPNVSSRRHLLIPLAIICVFGQWIISLSLKNQMVVDHLMPQLQQKFDDGLRWAALNETLYWLRFNQSAAQTYTEHQRARPGFQLASQGAKRNYPVIMIPGFVTSGLEVWEGRDCARSYFRERMWGGVGSVQHWLMERHCVMEHLALDPFTGKDPDGIRIRAAQGFEAADYFMGNFWVWGKVLENLADVGYDGSTMSMESYDWRLSFAKLEERDGFLTKLKYKIEAFYQITGKKVVITSHSLGVMLVHYFFAWVTKDDREWVDKHVHTFVNIAGAHLGAPKAASAILSGEMSDTLFMGAVGSLVENFIGRKVRKELWATWGSLWNLLPKGGAAVWGDIITVTNNDNKSIDETESPAYEDMTIEEAVEAFASHESHDSVEIMEFLDRWGGGYHEEKARNRLHDASVTPLPFAPKMKIYCLYGVGLETERSYFYKRNRALGPEDESPDPTIADPPFVVDTSIEDPEESTIHGIQYGDGDGSVPIESLGYLCADGWRRKDSKLNPSNIQVVTREYEHREEFSVDDPMRRGPHSGDHVDILGHNDMLTDLIRIVTGHDVDLVQDEFISDILDISKEISTRQGFGPKRKSWNALKFLKRHVRKLRSGLKRNKVLRFLRQLRLPLFKRKQNAAVVGE